MEAELTDHADLDWVCLRPPYLRDAPPTGGYLLDPDRSPRAVITTGDLADALLDAVTGTPPEQHTAFVASSPSRK